MHHKISTTTLGRYRYDCPKVDWILILLLYLIAYFIPDLETGKTTLLLFAHQNDSKILNYLSLSVIGGRLY